MSPTTRGKKVPVRAVPKEEPEDLDIDAEEPVEEQEATEPTIEVEEEELQAVPMHNPSLRLYRHLAIGFVLLVAAVLGVVLFVATVKATIKVHPVEETISSEVLLDVVKTPTKENEIRGTVLSGQLSRTQTATPSGEGAKQVEGTAKGSVTIYNTTNTNQQLVVNTRLLTAEGVLFRIDAGVTVPANGSVEVAVHADQPGAAGDIAASRFTIPGLSESLQQVIYAQSTIAFTGGVSSVSAIGQADIDRAYEALKSSLEEDAKAMLRGETGGGLAGESFTSAVLEQSTEAKVGDEASSFEVSMKLEVTGVFFDEEAAEEIVTRALYAKLPQGKEFASVNSDGMQATVEKSDLEAGTANVRVYEDALATASLTSPALQPGRFVGMTQEEVLQTLSSEGIAKSVEIEFFPSWIHKVPQLKDHVFLEIR
jgi:hypothetical protein